jgi:hypothetical protein
MIKGNLAVKGARFDGRAQIDDLVLSGRGANDIKQAAQRNILYDDRGGAETYKVRSSSPTPSVASMMSAVQNDPQRFYQDQNTQNFGPPASGVGKQAGSTFNAYQYSNANPSKLAGAAGTAAVLEAMERQKNAAAAAADGMSVSSGSSTHTAVASASQSATKGAGGHGHKIARYWTAPMDQQNAEDVVVIHVCDENRQVSKDFCCKRDILVGHMKYFEKFLKENESGYDDIDISVHCDVEIFEWLMTYIHEQDKPPVLDKSIVVSILISSDFLQMETLVEHCLAHISTNLNETIRLPIDLSCISDKIVNRLAALTHPKTLANTKDRKDKILNKLYKRRVELDFSRKSGARGGIRTIAASLTCCRYCGIVYLDNWVSFMHCKNSPLAIDYRGKLSKRHSPIPQWSLTAYLKNLHVSGMNWDSIYWHVWACCQVFRVKDFIVSAIETERYSIEADGLAISAPELGSGPDSTGTGTGTSSSNAAVPSSSSPTAASSREVAAVPSFSLGSEECSTQPRGQYKLKISPFEQKAAFSQITYTLNPARPPEVLPPQIFELVCTQNKYLLAQANKSIVQKQSQDMVLAAKASNDPKTFNFQAALWGDSDAADGGGADDAEERHRGRSRSPNATRKTKSEKGGALLTSKSASRVSGSGGGGGGGVPGKEPRRSKTDKGKARDKDDSVERRDSGGAKNGARDSSADSDGQSDDDNAGSNSEGEAQGQGPTDVSARRSRSMGPGATAPAALSGAAAKAKDSAAGKDSRKALSGGASGRLMPRTVHNPGELGAMGLCRGNAFLSRQLSMFRVVPPDVVQKVHGSKGSFRGLWLQPHPLQLNPSAFAETFNAIKEKTDVAESKRFEWHMDLLREYDEKRSEKMEAFLGQHRNASESNARSASIVHAVGMVKAASAAAGGPASVATKLNGRDVYYRDRARQPVPTYG